MALCRLNGPALIVAGEAVAGVVNDRGTGKAPRSKEAGWRGHALTFVG